MTASGDAQRSGFEIHSALMQFLLKLGFERLAWAVRRLHCPVDREALVLEVGSGGNPYPRANVLVDAYEDTRERHWVPLTADRPTVLGFAENLPFKDKSFDFVIAAHVLEHSPYPEKFLAELQRVAKAGYIETPDAFMERVNPYRDHRLEVTVRDGALVINKKPSWRVDDAVVELYEPRAKRRIAGETIPHHPFDFHVRYYWRDKIAFTVTNPQADATWTAPESGAPMAHVAPSGGWRVRVNAMLRAIFSQTSRNKTIDLVSTLQCPNCKSGQIHRESDQRLVCGDCKTGYTVKNHVPVMTQAPS